MSVEDIVVVTEVHEVVSPLDSVVVAFDATPNVIETNEADTVVTEVQDVSVIETLDPTAVILTEGIQGPPGASGADGASATSVFITDVSSLTGLVGSKVYDPGTVPANATLASCVTDTPLVRVTVAADGGSSKYSPDVTVNDLPVTLIESVTKRWFTGTVDVPLTEETTTLVARSGSTEHSVVVTLAGAGPAVLSAAFGAYPGTQTALKLGDALAVSIAAENDAVSVTITGPAATVTLPVVAGVANGTLIMSGATGSQTFSVVAKNSFGTAGEAYTTATVLLDQVYPTFGARVVLYPENRFALGVGEAATVACTVLNADSVSYGGTGLTVDGPTTYALAKNVDHTLTGYTTAVYTISATRNANGASASTTASILIATVAPTAGIGITPSGRLVSSPIGLDYVVRITPNQTLLSAPSITAPVGTWQGAGFSGVGSYWTRTLRIADADARGLAAFTGLTLTGPSGIAGSTITAGSTYTVGGFSSRNVTFPAFSRVTALGVQVGLAAKLSAQVVGGNVLTLQANNAVVANGFYPANADGSYNATGTYLGLSDSAFAGANTSGTLQVTVSEAA